MAKRNPVLVAADETNAANGRPTDQAGLAMGMRAGTEGPRALGTSRSGFAPGAIFPETEPKVPVVIHLVEMETSVQHVGPNGVRTLCDLPSGGIQVGAPLDHPSFCATCRTNREKLRKGVVAAPIMVSRP